MKLLGASEIYAIFIPNVHLVFGPLYFFHMMTSFFIRTRYKTLFSCNWNKCWRIIASWHYLIQKIHFSKLLVPLLSEKAQYLPKQRARGKCNFFLQFTYFRGRLLHLYWIYCHRLIFLTATVPDNWFKRPHKTFHGPQINS